MFAIIETCGKQYKVQEGDVVFLEKLDAEAGQDIKFDKIVAFGDGEDVRIGTPYAEGCEVSGKVVKSGKSRKIIVFKYNAKKNYRRRQGHRQPYTKVQIEKISAQ